MKNSKHLISKSSMLLRIVAGAYLIYLVYQLITGMSNVAAGPSRIVSCIATGVFAAVGLWLVVTSAKAFLTGNYQGGVKDTSTTKDDVIDVAASVVEENATETEQETVTTEDSSSAE